MLLDSNILREKAADRRKQQRIAMLSAGRGVHMPGNIFQMRDLSMMPKVRVETSSYLSKDRDGR